MITRSSISRSTTSTQRPEGLAREIGPLYGCSSSPPRHLAITCSSHASTRPISNLTEDDAVRTANLDAQRRGIDLTHYHEPHARYDANWQVWRVLYQGRPVDGEPFGLGRHFMINVH